MNQSFNQTYPLDSPTDSTAKTESSSSSKLFIERYGEGIAALTSGVLIIIAWMLSESYSSISIAIYLLAFIIGGYVKAMEGLHTLIKERDLDVNLLMIFAAIGAATIGYWAEGALLIFIFSLSGALETYTMNRSHRDISALMDLKPETAVLYIDGQEKLVPIDQLQPGDLIIVKPGEMIPADGTIHEGVSSVNQASITGESIPVDKTSGDEVFAGTLNGQGALFIQVTQPSESTLFARIIRLVQEAKSEKPASQQFIERFERIYARAIIGVTLLLILIPPILLQWTWESTFYKAMVFLVVASPCALVASIMPAMLSAISNSARKGLLLKGGAHLENLSQTKVIAFDKTGTLTEGRPVVTDVLAYEGYSEAQVLQIAGSIESLSTHPLAKAIVAKAKEEHVQLQRPAALESLTGWGIQGELNGEAWRIGKPAQLEHAIPENVLQNIQQLQAEGKTVSIVIGAIGVIGVIALQDRIRPQAKTAIQFIHSHGIQVAMLTGDHQKTAEAIAKEAGIDLVYAELLPEDKVSRVKQLREQYGSVTMVGDGVNDAPALATASVGIAMGTDGSDAALETADIVLMNDDLEKISTAITLGKRAKRIVMQNIVFSISIIALLIAANFIQGISLPLGVIGHEGSTILVILNGLRLLR